MTNVGEAAFEASIYYMKKRRRGRIDNGKVTAWAPGQAVTIGTKRRSFNKIYSATTNGTTGATPPSWFTRASDGTVTWQFVSA